MPSNPVLLARLAALSAFNVQIAKFENDTLVHVEFFPRLGPPLSDDEADPEKLAQNTYELALTRLGARGGPPKSDEGESRGE